MLFFDNMEDNISDITTLGEYSQWNQVYWPLLLSGTHKLFYEAMADSVNAIIIGSSVRKTFSVGVTCFYIEDQAGGLTMDRFKTGLEQFSHKYSQ